MAGRQRRAGRESAAAVQRAAERYFRAAQERGETVSEQGLAAALGMTVRRLRELYDAAPDEALRDTVQNAYSRMTAEYIRLLSTGNKAFTPFVLLMLKQPRFADYRDKAEGRQEVSVRICMGKGMDESDFL